MPVEDSGPPRVAAVTGASSGIGAATAAALAQAGFRVYAGARRTDRLRQLAGETGAVPLELDVTQSPSVEAFGAAIREGSGRLDVLVNNAGLALGRDPVAESRDEDWELMLQTNLVGAARVTRELLPLVRSAQGHIVILGSVTAFEVYPGGAAYAASKWGVRAMTRSLRLELNGEPVRVTEIDPGLTETEFSTVRFGGDEARARQVYAGSDPLRPADVAECIVFAVTRPARVNVDELVVRPVTEASAFWLNRRPRF